jgi:hypothetical protein
MKFYTTIAQIAAFFLLIPTFSNAQTVFNYTGGLQTYTVPLGVTMIQIEAYGAQGGGSTGGLGGYAIADLPVNPGAVLEVHVGGQPTIQEGPGGYNGGGGATIDPCGGSGGWPGGGASDVRLTASLNDRIIVAGGGGGGGWSGGFGGVGGGAIGGDGDASWIVDTHGQGGTQIAGGAGGVYPSGPNSPAPSGTFGFGGASMPVSTYCTGGGGGGGWYGGGGGYVSAAGGGSSYVSYAGTLNPTTTAGLQTGNGQIIITPLCSGLTVSVSSNLVCEGDWVTLDATSSLGGNITWDNGVTNGVPFQPSVGITTYIATSDDPADCGFSTDIEVLASPSITATVDDATVCMGDAITLTGVGGLTHTWDNGATDGVSYVPTSGPGFVMFHVTGLDAAGCSGTDSIEVFFSSPAISANITNEVLGGDGAIDITVTGGLGSYAYSWSSGPITEDINGLTAGTYTVTVDDGECSVDSTFTILNVAAIGENTIANLEVHPNPASDNLTISLEGEFTFELIDLSGQVLQQGSGSDDVEIDVTPFSSGAYFVVITQDNNTDKIKIIIE